MDIKEACRVLFGPQFKVTPGTLTYLHPSGIKNAFREKAKILHPDSRRELPADAEADFCSLRDAYEFLLGLTEGSRAAGDPLCPAPQEPAGAKEEQRDFYYRGRIPSCALRLGEYLYYTGRISWNTLIDAIHHQRTTRPRIGDICAEHRFIDRKDKQQVLNNMGRQEKFGQVAMRLGIIKESQIRYALQKQKNIYPFGRYFVEKGILTSGELNHYLVKLRCHNSRFSGKENLSA